MASHSSGIPVSPALHDHFIDVHRAGSKRAIKVQIVNEEMVSVLDIDATGSFEEDLDKVVEVLQPKEACYLLVRMDEQNENGYRWLLDCFVPDACKVREKMMYASSRATLKLSLGSYWAHDIFGTVKGDFNKAGFEAYVRMQKSAAPLTESEEAREFESAAVAAEAARGASPCKSPSSMVHGVSFAATEEAQSAITALVGGAAENYVQLGIDEEKELIILNEKCALTLDALAGKVPLDRPAFHFLRYDHEHEGSSLASVVYVYSCPDGSGNTKSAPVKARMLYSSCKGCVEALAGEGKVALRLEINEGEEVAEQAVVHKLHPPPVEKKEAFARPKPAGKGPKRLIR